MALLMGGAGPAAFDSDWSATWGQLRRCEVLAAQELRRQDAAITPHERGE